MNRVTRKRTRPLFLLYTAMLLFSLKIYIDGDLIRNTDSPAKGMTYQTVENVPKNKVDLNDSIAGWNSKSETLFEFRDEFENLSEYKVLKPDVRPNGKPKTILFWTNWEPDSSWEDRFGSERDLRQEFCPSVKCEFTKNRKHHWNADAILFKSDRVHTIQFPRRSKVDQRWVWVESDNTSSTSLHLTRNHFFNWTMGYHSTSDIALMSGYLVGFTPMERPLRPYIITEHPETLGRYLADMALNTTLAEVMGIAWRDFVTRPKLAVWVSQGNCTTTSGREKYVQMLMKYVHVEIFGDCGRFTCKTWGYASEDSCWSKYVGSKFLFALALEDRLCHEYVTSELWKPLKHGLVPVVWGGSDYERLLPPGSYIDARRYSPRDLGNLLTLLQREPVEYGKFHIWRRHWKVNARSSMCELCHKLHTDTTRGHHTDIPMWRQQIEQCVEAPAYISQENEWGVERSLGGSPDIH